MKVLKNSITNFMKKIPDSIKTYVSYNTYNEVFLTDDLH